MIEKEPKEEISLDNQSGDYFPDEEEYNKHAKMQDYYDNKAMKDMEADSSSEIVTIEHPMDIFDRKTIAEYKEAGKSLPIDAPPLTAEEVIEMMKQQSDFPFLHLYTDDLPDGYVPYDEDILRENEAKAEGQSKLESLHRLLDPYKVELKDFEQLDGTPFRLNAFNGVYAPAKAGKTYFVLDQLNKIDTSKYTTIWLDADRNAELKDKFTNIQHIALADATSAFKALIGSKRTYDNWIFVLDSYKDFSFGLDTDTNKGSQQVFETYQLLLNLGATVVIIFHSTKSFSKDGKPHIKLKGNADTIESKMDFLYKLERNFKDNYVSLTVQCSRAADVKIGDTISYASPIR